jgi:hypothetical protein
MLGKPRKALSHTLWIAVFVFGTVDFDRLPNSPPAEFPLSVLPIAL